MFCTFCACSYDAFLDVSSHDGQSDPPHQHVMNNDQTGSDRVQRVFQRLQHYECLICHGYTVFILNLHKNTVLY